MSHPLSKQQEGESYAPPQSMGTNLKQNSGQKRSFRLDMFDFLVFGGIIAIYQFFNELEHFCFNIPIGEPCKYPPEYYYPALLLLILVLSSMSYSLVQLIRREWMHGAGIFLGGCISIAMFIISSMIVFFMN
tara:strand:- start:646 stop:1041 length:396 start_codon:yes stop_codon:yes gene_type:complete